MADITELLDQAAEIRDADTENENTALRVGTLLVNIITRLNAGMTKDEVTAAINTALSGISDWSERVPLIEQSTLLLELINSRCVLLDAMGTDFDDGQEYTPVAGDRVYRNGYVWTWNGSGWDQGGIPPKKHVLYINRLTGRQYAWNGSLMVEIVNPNSASGGGTTVTIDDSGDYVDLIIADNTPKLTVSTTSIVMSGNTKTATFKVSGAKLTAPILIRTNNAYFTASPSSISPTGGTVAETTVTVTFGGSTNQEDDIVVSSQGASSKTIHAQYTEEQVPTISVEDTPLSFKAAAGATQQKTLSVSGVNLEAAIAATVEGTNADKFTVSPASISQSGGSASGTLTITYTPGAGASGTHTATLKLTTTNGQTKSITLNGAVAGTLAISPASDAIGIISGGSGTATFRVQGANLTPNATIAVSVNGTGMTVSPSTLSVDSHGEIDDDVTVTFSGTADSSGTLTAACQTDEVSATASVVGNIVTPLPADASFKVGGIHYKVNADQQSVRVWNGSSESGAASTRYSGAITIPASVSDSGVTATLSGGGTQEGAGCTYAVTTLATYAFGNCNNMTSLTLPEGLETIKTGAIRECKNASFKTLIIPSTVKYIDALFLWDCTYLETVDMRCYKNTGWDSGNTSWGGNNSGNCNKVTQLKEFKIPDGFTTYVGAGDYGNFKGCTALETITLGKGLTNFNDLFSQITGVTKIYCRSTVPPKINASASTTYSIPTSVYQNAQVYVPRGYRQAYLDAYDSRQVSGAKVYMWKNFNDYHALIEYDPD